MKSKLQFMGNAGNTLLTVVIACAISAGLMIGISQTLKVSFAGAKATELSTELTMIQQVIARDLDCNATLNGEDPDGPHCSTTSAAGGQNSAPVYLRLRRKTLDGSVKYLTGPLVDGVAKLGDWTLRATCSASEQSLVIRAARPLNGGFETSFTGQAADWNNPKGLLFGGAPGSIPLCYSAPIPPGGGNGGGGPVVANGPKRFAVFRLRFDVLNDGSEFALVDLQNGAPKIISAHSASIASESSTSSFDSTGKMTAMVAVYRVDVRSPYYNVATSSPISYTFPTPGQIRVQLGHSGDIGGGKAPFGTMWISVMVYQQ